MSPIAITFALAGVAFATLPEPSGVTAGDVISEVRDVARFDALAVGGSLLVEVQRGTPASVVVEGPADEVAGVGSYVKGSTLHLEGGGDGVKVRVTAPDLGEVAVAGSGRIAANGKWKRESFEVAIAGSGQLDIDVDADRMEVAVSGSGRIRLAGEAQIAEVAIQGSGSVELGVRKKLEVAIMGSGSVTYRGPDSVELEKALLGSGRVTRKK